MTEIRRIYRINAATPEDINYVLSQVGDRLDQLEGFRGKGNFLVAPSSEQQAAAGTDLARYDQVITYTDAKVSGIFGSTIVTVSANSVKVYAQDNDTLLHGFGDLI